MKSIYINNDGDFEFDKLHDIKTIEDADEVRQRTRLTLGTNQSEWIFNLRFGVPWFEMLSEGEPQESFRKEVIRVLDNDPAIDEIVDVDLDFDRGQRALEIDFEVIIDDESYREKVVI